MDRDLATTGAPPAVPESDPERVDWRMIRDALTRPYPVTVPMLILVSLIPLYIFIPALLPDRTLYAPAIGLDSLFPVAPAWAFVYGPLYWFLIILPVLALRQREHVDRTVRAYLLIWLTAYVFFIAYPTIAPRPAEVLGDGFGAWGLRALYDMDPPNNCFPSLHVAHSFVSALTIYRLHRRLGIVACVCASLVALSTLFTKQHWALDVFAGLLLAWIAYRLFLRGYSRERVHELDRRVAPALAAGAMAFSVFGVAVAWLIYRLS